MELKGKRVLVTGADGFIGSHLCETLVSECKSLRALSYYNSFNDWGWLERVQGIEQIDVRCGDVRDPNFCRELCKDIDVVFHLAALIAIPYSYIAPSSYIQTNITGTLNMLEGARDAGVQRFLQTSTSEVYGTAKYIPINEEHPLQPQSPYSASKIGADSIASSFYSSFEFPVSIVRPFNTFGPRQSARAVIPTIISQVAAGKKNIKLGALSPTRDFNYVKDTCNGFLSIARCEKAMGEVINIGSNFEVSIGDTVKTILRLMDAQDVDIQTDEQRIRPKASEVERLWCDNTKINKLTGFEPKYGFEKGLSETIQWFTNPENLKRYKTDIYNV